MPRPASHCINGGTIPETSTRRGLEMIPTVLKADMSVSDSTLADFPGVEKKLLVAFGAGQTARQHTQAFESVCLGLPFHRGDGFFVQRRIFYDTPGADVFAAQFELWLDQDKKYRARFCGAYRGSKNLRHGNKRNICNDEIHL